jgi:predicted PurR-regulated permease PerM
MSERCRPTQRLPPRVARRDDASDDNTTTSMPLPQDLQSFLLTGIFALLIFVALYFTGAIVLPIIFAFILNLLMQPAMRAFARLGLPRTAAAILVIAALLCGLAALGSSLSGPAAEWIAKAPATIPRLEERLSVLKVPIAQLRGMSEEIERIAGSSSAGRTTVAVEGPGLGSVLFSGTRSLLQGFVATAVLLFFLLVSGDLFLRRLVEILPTFRDKKQAVEISHEIERNISAYLVTITLMNTAVGIATGLEAYLFGLSDPVLWGALAFVLNYMMIIGPLAVTIVLLLAGILTFDTGWQAILPAGVYFMIHLIEGESVTPMLLARRFTLNPVLVIVSLLFWQWMWGIAGVLLAVPVLAIFKIVCDRIRPLMALGHFLGGEARD